MNEFSLIDKYFNWGESELVELGVGDDCAIINSDINQQLVTSVDTLIEGVHFSKNTPASDIAYKALAVNLSDLAAMGAVPKFFTLALTLPKLDEPWLEAFSTSLQLLAKKYNIDLIGGDTTKGHLSITINVTGGVKQGEALLRSSAQADDVIFVSNTIGDAALAWWQLNNGQTPSKALLSQLNTPEPQIELGKKISTIANACIDISDGLEQDLSHILNRSGVGAKVNLNDIPLSDEVQTHIKQTNDWCLPLSGGDDYELCFTVSPDKVVEVESLTQTLNIQLSAIGVITLEKGIKRLGDFHQECHSYQHF